MTKEQFENTKWYKNMPVYIDNELFFVKGVDFEEDMISVSDRQYEVSKIYWFPFNEVKVKDQPPTDLDIIAAEREKQISKGYTVENDAGSNDHCQLS